MKGEEDFLQKVPSSPFDLPPLTIRPQAIVKGALTIFTSDGAKFISG